MLHLAGSRRPKWEIKRGTVSSHRCSRLVYSPNLVLTQTWCHKSVASLLLLGLKDNQDFELGQGPSILPYQLVLCANRFCVKEPHLAKGSSFLDHTKYLQFREGSRCLDRTDLERLPNDFGTLEHIRAGCLGS